MAFDRIHTRSNKRQQKEGIRYSCLAQTQKWDRQKRGTYLPLLCKNFLQTFDMNKNKPNRLYYVYATIYALVPALAVAYGVLIDKLSLLDSLNKNIALNSFLMCYIVIFYLLDIRYKDFKVRWVIFKRLCRKAIRLLLRASLLGALIFTCFEVIIFDTKDVEHNILMLCLLPMTICYVLMLLTHIFNLEENIEPLATLLKSIIMGRSTVMSLGIIYYFMLDCNDYVEYYLITQCLYVLIYLGIIYIERTSKNE